MASSTFIDLEGLHPDTIRILNLKGEPIDKDNRLLRLAMAHKGHRGTIITGPSKANWWTLVGGATNVQLAPDGQEYKLRQTVFEWACYQVTDTRTAKKLITRKKPPSRGALVEPWIAAKFLEQQFNDVLATVPEPESSVQIVYNTSFLDSNELVSMDWEWDPSTKSPLGLAVSNSTTDWYLPVRSQGTVLYNAQRARSEWSSALRNRVPCVFHNGRADIGTQYDNDPIELLDHPIDDTLVMAFLDDPNSNDLGLKALTPKYLGRRAIPYPGNVENLPLKLAAEYAAGSDTRNTYDLRRVLVNNLIANKQWKIYTDIERPLVPIVASMEKYGVPVDIKRVLETYRESVIVENSFIEFWQGQNYSIRHSRKQDNNLRKYVSSILGFDPGDMDQRTLSGWPNGEIDLVLYFKRLRTRRNNFLRAIIKGWYTAGCPDEYYIYPSYNQAGVDNGQAEFGRAPRTGRFSSSGPNFQQQPRDLRYIYIPPKGCLWWKYDYSQLELRIAANLSKDKNLIYDLLSGDPHGNFQRYILDITGRDPGRSTAKTANFEKLYFGGDGQLVRVLQKERVFIDMELARSISRAHKERYAGHYEYAKSVVGNARQNGGYFYTNSGRQRQISEIYHPDSGIANHGERAGINHTIQGYAADLVKRVMHMLIPILNSYGAHMAITVHDELDGWVPEDVDLVKFDRDVRDCMQSINIGPVPLLVDGGVRRSWAG